MRSSLLVLISILLLPALLAARQKGPLKTQREKVSYTIGLDIGKNFKRQLADVDLKLLAQGIKDGLSDTKPLLSAEEAREVMMTFQKEQTAKDGRKRQEGRREKQERGRCLPG